MILVSLNQDLIIFIQKSSFSTEKTEFNLQYLANIKFCVKLEKKFAETYELMKKVYGDGCMSPTQVYTSFTRFKNAREDLNDDLRPGCPEVSNRAQLVEKVREIIGIDVDFTTRMLAEELKCE